MQQALSSTSINCSRRALENTDTALHADSNHRHKPNRNLPHFERRFYNCDSPQHLARHCPRGFKGKFNANNNSRNCDSWQQHGARFAGKSNQRMSESKTQAEECAFDVGETLNDIHNHEWLINSGGNSSPDSTCLYFCHVHQVQPTRKSLDSEWSRSWRHWLWYSQDISMYQLTCTKKGYTIWCASCTWFTTKLVFSTICSK